MFSNDDNDSDNADFTLFGKNEIKNEEKTESINKIEEQEQKEKIVINDEEIKNVLKGMNLKLNEYYYVYRILKSFDEPDQDSHEGFNRSNLIINYIYNFLYNRLF